MLPRCPRGQPYWNVIVNDAARLPRKGHSGDSRAHFERKVALQDRYIAFAAAAILHLSMLFIPIEMAHMNPREAPQIAHLKLVWNDNQYVPSHLSADQAERAEANIPAAPKDELGRRRPSLSHANVTKPKRLADERNIPPRGASRAQQLQARDVAPPKVPKADEKNDETPRYLPQGSAMAGGTSPETKEQGFAAPVPQSTGETAQLASAIAGKESPGGGAATGDVAVDSLPPSVEAAATGAGSSQPSDENYPVAGSPRSSPASEGSSPSANDVLLRMSALIAERKAYPEAARLKSIEGKVKIRVLIQADGGLKSLNILTRSGSAILDRAALDLVKGLFPLELGLEREMEVLVPIEYRLIR